MYLYIFKSLLHSLNGCNYIFFSVIMDSFIYFTYIAPISMARAAEKFKLPGSADQENQDFLRKCVISRQKDKDIFVGGVPTGSHTSIYR